MTRTEIYSAMAQSAGIVRVGGTAAGDGFPRTGACNGERVKSIGRMGAKMVDKPHTWATEGDVSRCQRCSTVRVKATFDGKTYTRFW